MPSRSAKKKDKSQLCRSASMPREHESEIPGIGSISRAEGQRVAERVRMPPDVPPDTPIERTASDICEEAGVQHFGMLWKKISAGKGAVRWSSRFCVVKEGFLFYYSESEAKVFEETSEFNQHPRVRPQIQMLTNTWQGVVPLGRATVEPCVEIGRNHCVVIVTHRRKQMLTFDCKTAEQKELWLFMLRDASTLTLENAELGEAMIRELENQGLRLHKEKQQYIDKLNSEITALQKETEKNQTSGFATSSIGKRKL